MIDALLEKVMAQNDVLALQSNFQTWKKNRFPSEPESPDIYQYYCVEQFTRAFDLGDSQLKSGIVDKGGDGGVDAFFVLANGELVDSETEVDPKEPPDFKVLIMQVKSDEGFSPTQIDKLYWFTDDLFDLSKKKADYHTQYHNDLIALMRVFKDKFGMVVGETPEISIDYIYIIKKDVNPNQDCVTASTNVVARASHYINQAVAQFKYVNAAAMWAQVQSRPPKKKTIKWASQPLSTQEGEIGLVRLADYYEFVKDPGGKIAERFFDSNVRGYWPTSNLNKQIAITLKSEKSPEFWLLNNGITILAEKTEAGKFLEIVIHDPQIVNGLQTSRQIFNHFSANDPSSDDDRRVLVRVIRSADKTTRDEVIRCTNSQNVMPDEALRATDPIHRQLETAFHTVGLYYDRRKGHYRDQGKPVAQIVSVIEVLQAILCIVLQKPNQARGRPKDYIKKNELYESVFGPDKYTLTLYLKVSEICRRVDSFLSHQAMEMIHRRNVYYYLCMYASCELTKTGYANPSLVHKIEIQDLTDTLLKTWLDRVMDVYETLTATEAVSGEKDYDAVAKGSKLLEILLKELRAKWNPSTKADTI